MDSCMKFLGCSLQRVFLLISILNEHCFAYILKYLPFHFICVPYVIFHLLFLFDVAWLVADSFRCWLLCSLGGKCGKSSCLAAPAVLLAARCALLSVPVRVACCAAGGNVQLRRIFFFSELRCPAALLPELRCAAQLRYCAAPWAALRCPAAQLRYPSSCTLVCVVH